MSTRNDRGMCRKKLSEQYYSVPVFMCSGNGVAHSCRMTV